MEYERSGRRRAGGPRREYENAAPGLSSARRPDAYVQAAPRPWESASLYWMTSEAWRRTWWGMVRPRAWAVRRLMAKSKRIGRSMGRSAGFAPLRILSTNTAARRTRSVVFVP